MAVRREEARTTVDPIGQSRDERCHRLQRLLLVILARDHIPHARVVVAPDGVVKLHLPFGLDKNWVCVHSCCLCVAGYVRFALSSH